MSDQDFFFEDDEKPTAKSDSKAKSGTQSSRPANKSGTQSSRPANKSGTPSSRPAPTASSGGTGGQSVTMTMAILFAVIGVLLGVVIGLFIGSVVNPASSNNAGAPPSQVAPTLTQDQINAGQLPAGHPKITGGSVAPSATATKTK